MRIPEFKRRLTFLHDVRVPCLRAVLANSIVPELAARYMAKHIEAPLFEIFLRGEKPAKISVWQKEMLDRLLDEGELKRAIEQGIDGYLDEHQNDPVPESEKQARGDMRKSGILPHFVLNGVVIDDSRREVILTLSTDSDLNLQEHGVVIYSDGDHWKFDPDHLSVYFNAVEEEEEGRGEYDFKEDEEEADAQEKTQADVGLLFGTWTYDEVAHRDALQKAGLSESDVRNTCDHLRGRQYGISQGRLLCWYRHQRKPDEHVITALKMVKNKLTIRFKNSVTQHDDVREFRYEGDFLIGSDGPYRQTVNSLIRFCPG